MLKAKSGTVLIVGISGENVKRLKGGQSIHIDLKEMGITEEIIIFYKETDDDLVQAITPYIDHRTKIHEGKD